MGWNVRDLNSLWTYRPIAHRNNYKCTPSARSGVTVLSCRSVLQKCRLSKWSPWLLSLLDVASSNLAHVAPWSSVIHLNRRTEGGSKSLYGLCSSRTPRVYMGIILLPPTPSSIPLSWSLGAQQWLKTSSPRGTPGSSWAKQKCPDKLPACSMALPFSSLLAWVRPFTADRQAGRAAGSSWDYANTYYLLSERYLAAMT